MTCPSCLAPAPTHADGCRAVILYQELAANEWFRLDDDAISSIAEALAAERLAERERIAPQLVGAQAACLDAARLLRQSFSIGNDSPCGSCMTRWGERGRLGTQDQPGGDDDLRGTHAPDCEAMTTADALETLAAVLAAKRPGKETSK